MEIPTNILIIWLISLFLINKALTVSSQYHFVSEFCIDQVGNYTTNSTYDNNLNILLSTLTNQASSTQFNNNTVGQGIDQTYGLFLCRPDLNLQQCHDCVSVASSTLGERCPVQKQATVWYQECLVRYANHSIFSVSDDGPLGVYASVNNVSDPDRFRQAFLRIVNVVIMQTAYNVSSRGYAGGQEEYTVADTVYVVAQCTPDILGNQCERCLRVALRNMGSCCGTESLFLDMYLPSCWLRYGPVPIVGEVNRTSTVSPSPPPLAPSLSPPPPPPPEISAAITISRGISLMFVNMLILSISVIRHW